MTLLAAGATTLATLYAVGLLLGTAPRLRLAASPRPGPGPSPGQVWLTQAGVALTPLQFWAGSAAVGIAAYLLVAALTATPVVAVAPAVAAGLAPRVAVARQRLRRLREVAEAWPDGLREVMGAIAAGRSLSQALVGLAESGPLPLRNAFARVPALVRMVGTVPALETVKAELADPTSDRVLEVLILAHQRGGRAVADILRDLTDATAADVRTADEIETDALEQKINARAVFALPWLVLLLLTSQPGDFRAFYQSPAGALVVAVGGVASLFGMWLVGRLARDPLEERVLAPAPAADVGLEEAAGPGAGAAWGAGAGPP